MIPFRCHKYDMKQSHLRLPLPALESHIDAWRALHCVLSSVRRTVMTHEFEQIYGFIYTCKCHLSSHHQKTPKHIYYNSWHSTKPAIAKCTPPTPPIHKSTVFSLSYIYHPLTPLSAGLRSHSQANQSLRVVGKRPIPLTFHSPSANKATLPRT